MTPGFCCISEDESSYYLVDGPGIYDTSKMREFPNQNSIQYILKNSNKFKLVLVVCATDLIENRG